MNLSRKLWSRYLRFDIFANGLLGFGFLWLGIRFGVFVPLGALFLALAQHAQLSTEFSTLGVDRATGTLLIRRLFGLEQLDLRAVRSVVQNPFRSRIELRTEGRSVVVQRTYANLKLLEDLGQIRSFRGVGRAQVRFPVSRYNLVMFTILLVLQSVTATILVWSPGVVRWITLGLLAPSLVATVVLALRHPLSFELSADTFRVNRVWERREYSVREVVQSHTDRYFFAGAPYFIVRLQFGDRAYVLDEYYLKNPLYPHREWIEGTWIRSPRLG